MRIDTAATLACLRAHQAEFENMGVRHLALFGSQVRGEADDASDVDVAVVFDESAHREGLAYFARRQRVADRLSAILAAEVDLSDEAMQRPLVREAYEADRVYAF
jgi:uncharacterized protein